MKKARFTESQIVAILKEADAGLPAGDVIRSASYYSGRPNTAGWMPQSSSGSMN